ncbi:MAG TPA: prepilin-type N-terminal cleavage/methylation domain-containing protein [Rubrivivax sp.]|nr:prepilin-type N-terminal cleavage/methylation domain-containing protein [Rubrivivax sp.]
MPLAFAAAPRRGFTLIELMVVIALLAIATGVVSLALRDPARTRLDTEAQRLGALLETARAESRASGVPVIWVPSLVDQERHFRFARLRGTQLETMDLPTHWLDPQVRAEVLGAPTVQLGPEPLIGAQRIVLRLADQRVLLATDGLAPFAVVADEAGQ